MKIKFDSLSSPHGVDQFLREKISFEQEEFWALALNSQLELIHAQCLFRGTVDLCLIHPRDIFRFAVVHNAAKLIVCHSHPSGNAEPSQEDHEVTRDLITAAKFLKIPLEDHLILSKTGIYSFRLSGQWACFQ